VSLKKIIATGAVNQVGRGTYQIGATTATAAVLTSDPVVKIASGKKVKAAKKVKAEAPAAKEVKAKAAPAKKAKAPIAKKAKSAARTAAKTVEVSVPPVEAEAAPL
jgi:hypothetical protein